MVRAGMDAVTTKMDPSVRANQIEEGTMITYVVLMNFTDQGIRNAKDTVKRADAFKEIAKKSGVNVREMFWTQGQYDLAVIIEAPDDIVATALNLSLSALGNVRTQSLRAFSAAEMNDVLAKML
jgi:uncharacterized protein with GYD domain